MSSRPKSHVLVARGDGWSYFWPVSLWDQLTAAQQRDIQEGQTAIMTGLSACLTKSRKVTKGVVHGEDTQTDRVTV